ncbi:hypothetical protein FVE85_7585 [Porphyridium purpureum]|uniref:Uncharacterized protein n=1 Tax=Porphyridium purpureum TaxID=35688 RepID=A0A5J4ZA47_PORPP|nr:hypothetical protein FVE85_7585 [Porphyridium purpureum]|eukprot:POR1536..scf295_1
MNFLRSFSSSFSSPEELNVHSAGSASSSFSSAGDEVRAPSQKASADVAASKPAAASIAPAAQAQGASMPTLGEMGRSKSVNRAANATLHYRDVWLQE